MTPLGSVTSWMAQARGGDPDAAQALWERYFRPLVTRVREQLRDAPRAVADEEDVALSAFDSVLRRAAQGQFPRFSDRRDLWSVLVMVASRKACDHVQRERRRKRDPRREERWGDGAGAADASLARLVSREPDPAFAAELADGVRKLFGSLPDDELRTIALRKLEGHTNEEIATQLGRAVSTVERRLALIRACWRTEGAEAGCPPETGNA
jgi:RNA polymerase sigma factor (sigma-70 family)